MKTADLTGAALDWAVCIAEGFKPKQLYINKYPHSSASIYTVTFDDDGFPDGYMTGPSRLYSTKWEAGGPIIEREHITTDYAYWGEWEAWDDKTMPPIRYKGATPLIAAMRCYVTSKLGDEVDVPKELL